MYRILSEGCQERLEPDIRKLISPVLRGGASSNGGPLPDSMRLTVLGQFVKGLPSYSTAAAEAVVSEAIIETSPKSKSKRKVKEIVVEEDDEAIKYPTAAELDKELERVKLYLWHGNAHKALQVLGDIEFGLEGCKLDKSKKGLVQPGLIKARYNQTHNTLPL